MHFLPLMRTQHQVIDPEIGIFIVSSLLARFLKAGFPLRDDIWTRRALLGNVQVSLIIADENPLKEGKMAPKLYIVPVTRE